MINKKLFLVKDIENAEKKKTRDGWGRGLVEAGKKSKKVVVLCCDLTESTRTNWFAEKFPERFIECGITEQHMASMAAGLSQVGKTAFISSYAAFSPGRNNEQIRTCISYNSWGAKKGQEVTVKIGGAHAGISVGPDGATHQALEDIGLMRMQPGMTVLVPCDDLECEKATIAAASYPGPVYIRFGRASYPRITTKKTPFRIGKAEVCHSGKDLALIACGPLVAEALKAAELLKGKISLRVINLHTISPIDKKAIIKAAKDCGAIVTAEEHQVTGGLGSAVSEVLAENAPVPLERVGVKDTFGESGAPDELFKHFGLTARHIIAACKRVMKRKR